MGFLDFKDRMLDYFKGLIEDVTENSFGQNGFFNTVVTMSAFGNDLIQIDNDIMGTDARGHFLLTNAALAGRTSGHQVENAAAVTYYVALQYAERPSGIQINPRTGFPEFLTMVEHIGVRDVPDLVTDHGDGTMTFRVNSVARPFAADVSNSLDQTGRTCLVWKKTPGATATTEALALLSGTIALSGGHNEVTVGSVGVNPFGQAPGSASEEETDYFVFLEGPTVSRQDLSVEPFTAFIGTFAGTGSGSPPGTFDVGSQNTLAPVLLADLGQITATHHGNLKLRTIADGADTDESQLEIQDSGGAPKMTVDEDGDTDIQGTLGVTGVTTLGTANISDLNVTADLSVTNDLDVGNETALGGALVPGQTLKTYGDGTIGDDDADTHVVRGDMKWTDNSVAVKAAIDSASGKVAIGGDTTTAGLKQHGPFVTELDTRVQLGLQMDGGTATEAEGPRVQYGPLNALSTVNMIEHFIASTGVTLGRQVRTCMEADGSAYWITVNAEWDGGSNVWFKDQNGDFAFGIQIKSAVGTQGAINVYIQDPTDDVAWGLTGWTSNILNYNLNNPSLRGEVTTESDVTTGPSATMTSGGPLVVTGDSTFNGANNDFTNGFDAQASSTVSAGTFSVGSSALSVPASGGDVDIGNVGTEDLIAHNNATVKSQLVLGEDIQSLPIATRATTPRIDLGLFGVSAVFNLLEKWGNTGSPASTGRIYVTNAGTRVYTRNAEFNQATSLFTKDVNGTLASSIALNSNVLRVQVRESGNDAPWSVSGWDKEHVLDPLNDIASIGDSSLFSNSVPVAASAQSHRLHSSNMVKAWARLDIDTGMLQGTNNIRSGFNMTSAASNGVFIDLTLASPPTDEFSTVCVATNNLDSSIINAQLLSAGPPHIRVGSFVAGTGAAVNLSSGNHDISVIVMGIQP